MKILIYTDNHFCANSSIVRSKTDRYSLRLENQIQSINWAEKLADEENCDLIIHCGDFFDKPDLNAEELSALKEIVWSKIPHKFLVGNHEMASSDLSINSLNVLSKVGQVVDKPTMESCYGSELIYLPYILESNRDTFKSYLSKLRSEYWADCWTTQEVKNTIVFSHNDLKGLQYGKYESKIGFDIDEINSNCTLFINGHLHNQTQVSEKILNLGNLTGQNFSEDGFKYAHCAAILDTETLKIDLVCNPYAINFYKLEYNEFIADDFSKDLNQIVNGIVTVKVKSKYVDTVKDMLNNCQNIFEYRVVSSPDLETVLCENKEKIITVDHISQFKNYVLEQLGSDEFVLEELDKLS